MTPDEYRKRHRSCGTCVYWKKDCCLDTRGVCTAKMREKWNTNGKFCRVYEAKEYHRIDKFKKSNPTPPIVKPSR
jgi:hypothetical protein